MLTRASRHRIVDCVIKSGPVPLLSDSIPIECLGLACRTLRECVAPRLAVSWLSGFEGRRRYSKQHARGGMNAGREEGRRILRERLLLGRRASRGDFRGLLEALKNNPDGQRTAVGREDRQGAYLKVPQPRRVCDGHLPVDVHTSMFIAPRGPACGRPAFRQPSQSMFASLPVAPSRSDRPAGRSYLR